MILGFLFFIQNFLKHCKALSTEKYRRYINIFYYYFIVLFGWLLFNCVTSKTKESCFKNECASGWHMSYQYVT